MQAKVVPPKRAARRRTPPIKSAAVSRQIFVSYSRRDAEIVRPLAHLLRATNDWVFLDSDSIRAGKKWRQEIDNAISAASLMIVFWCEHAEESEEVRREYAAAMDTQKDVLPVRLDRTALPDSLREFQALDFHDFAERFGHHGPAVKRNARFRPWHLVSALGGGIVLFSILFLLTVRSPSGTPAPTYSPLPWLAIVIVVTLALVFALRLAGKRKVPLPESAAPRPGPRSKAEAEILEEEVRRRLGLVA